ncbi:MAG: glucokinase [Betaproteobacteria bacterium]
MSGTDSYPLLVADIGGTNARFGWIADEGAPLSGLELVLCAQYERPQDAVLAYLRTYQNDARPLRTAIAIASVISPGPIKVTNSHWVLDTPAFAADTSCEKVDVFNDFEAIALALPHLEPGDYALVGKPLPDRRFAMGVIGPGTGLGVAGVLPVRGSSDCWQTVAGEGGHATLAATTDYHNEILRVARTQFSHVSAERLVSGIGLPMLRHAVAEVRGLDAGRPLEAEEIGTLGASREDALCEHTMEAFCSLLGVVAGNIALTLGARGGVFIAGGIVPKLGDFFAASGFREHFEAKGRYTEYLRAISTPVITLPYPALCGLVRHAETRAF